jgi:8-oxo-dGTP pyrophosphatase MutT (NUDIX family)
MTRSKTALRAAAPVRDVRSHADLLFAGGKPLVPEDAVVAMIVVDQTRYLLQLRDPKPGIFYPAHWGLFGGAVDQGEAAEDALRRELKEELGLSLAASRYFTEFTFDFGFCGRGRVFRRYFEIHIGESEVEALTLGEGEAMEAFAARQILSDLPVVPYDAFAIWLHATQRGQG